MNEVLGEIFGDYKTDTVSRGGYLSFFCQKKHHQNESYGRESKKTDPYSPQGDGPKLIKHFAVTSLVLQSPTGPEDCSPVLSQFG